MVKEFHQTMGLPTRMDVWKEGWPERQALRNQLMLEELSEYNKALASNDDIGIADALGDLLYVVYGTAVEHGIDIDRVFKEIHQSNMTKKDGHIDISGKLTKPDNYEKPDLSFILEIK